MSTDLWDAHGDPIAYIDDDKESVFFYDGTPIAWIAGNCLYTYRGRLLGWYYEGWIFGADGKCVLFGERAQPGATKPFRKNVGDRTDKTVCPSRSSRDTMRKRPIRASVWSGTSARAFFNP